MKNKIFKNAVMLVFTLGMAVMLATTADAASSKPCAPGCDCSTGADGKGILGQMERHGDVIRTRDKAYGQQIFKQPDNTVGMTCFDRALGVTSRIGQLFSDKVQEGAVKAMDDKIFGSSSFPDMGMDKVLLNEINRVVSPKMESHVKNFMPSLKGVSSGSLSSILGATNLGFLNNFASGLQGDINEIVNGPVKSVRSASKTLGTLTSVISEASSKLKILPPTTVLTVVVIIEGILNQIPSVIDNLMSKAMQFAKQLFGKISGKIMGSSNSLAAKPCERLDQLWSGKGAPGGFKSIIGSGLEKGTPYFSIDSLLKGQIPNAGPDFIQSVLNNANGPNSPLSKALKDLQGPLSGPGKMPSWTVPPIFTPNMSTSDVVKMMGGGGAGN